MLTPRKYITFLATLLLLSACTPSGTIDPEPEAYSLRVPDNFPVPVYDTDNPQTIKGVSLGKLLFHDTRLSGNNKISCATCHRPELAFSDGVALSTSGAFNTRLLRHSPALINLAWSNQGLFWDGGSTNLESQAFGPLTAHDEMNQDLIELVRELEADNNYPRLFNEAFSGKVSAANIVKALAQFQRTLISADSKYDKYKRNERGGFLTESEQKGLLLVRQKCQGCHATDLFTDNLYHNNGLDADFSDLSHDEIYLGRYRVSRDPKDIGAYRTPTLRNIAITAPYMHDGRFSSLEEVIDHYRYKVQISPSLAPVLSPKEDIRPGIQITDQEKTHIIAFLHTLTDETFLKNQDFKNPF